MRSFHWWLVMHATNELMLNMLILGIPSAILYLLRGRFKRLHIMSTRWTFDQ